MPFHLFDPVHYQLNLLTLQTLLVGLGLIFLGIFALVRMRRSPVSVMFFLLTLTVGEWLVAFSFVYATDDVRVAFWWAKAGYVGIAFIPAVLSNYISSIVQDFKKVRIRLPVYWIISAIFLVLILATDIQFSSLLHYSWGYYPRYGLTSLPFILFFFWVTLESLFRLFTAYRNLEKGTPQSVAARELLVGLLVGAVASVDYLIGFGINIPPFGYIPIFLFVVITTPSVFCNRLVAITPAFAARQIIDTMNDALLVLDREGIIRLVNQTACTMFGLSEEQLVGKAPTKAMGDNKAVAGVLATLIHGDVVSNLEMHYLRPGESEPGSLSLSASIMRDPAGAPFSVVCVVRDITRRKRTGEDLKPSVSLLRATLDATADGILVVDTNGMIVDYNIRFTELWRLPEDIIATREDRRALEFVQDQLKNPQGFLETVKELYANPAAESFDVLEFKDGRVFERSSKAQVIENTAVGRVWSFRDVTSQRKLEEELLKSQKLESLGVLAGGIAHDFNNILTAVMGNISLARMRAEPGDKLDKWLGDAEKATERAKDLTQQLLTFSKGGSPVKRIIALEHAIRDSASFALRGTAVKSVFRCDADLWPVEADEGQMVQVFNNLFINAGQAMSGRGILTIAAANVHVASHDSLLLAAGNYIKITVSDQGAGIPAEHLRRIFDPYFTTKEHGSGLGLAVAYSVIKNHGGLIQVASECGVGTTFTVFLPATDKTVEVAETAAELLPAGKGRVLLMDDEDIVIVVGSEMLTELGYDVAVARDGAAAVELFAEARGAGKPFAGVVLDLTIPGGMGGKEAIGRIRQLDPTVWVVVSSGYSNDPVMAEFMDYGFNAVVSKPYKVEELGRALQRHA
ncbi:MAG: PAS domain S-box protein [Deltaproteobacteria bacterium]|nr:PAS domain S-box protein [Deltaproteobacteria bacterium]